MPSDDHSFLSRLRRLLEGSTVPATITDPQGHVLFINAASERLLGRTLSEVQGERASAFFVEVDRVRGHGRIAAQGSRVEVDEVHLVHADGHRVPIAMVVADLRDEAETHVATVGLAVDLSQQRHLEQRLRDARDRLRFYYDLVTHDLRNYAQTMGGYLESLLDGKLGPLSDDQQRVLRICQRQTRRTNHLLSQVNVLLQAHDADESGAEANLSRVPLAPLVSQAVARVTAAYAERAPRIEAQVPEAAIVEVCPHFVEVLYSLISNAVIHNPVPEPRVWIRAEPCGESPAEPCGESPAERRSAPPAEPCGESPAERRSAPPAEPPGWRIFVEDDGPGLPQELCDQVLTDSGGFDRPGAGVGLRLVLAVLHRCGGRLRYENRVADAPERGVRAIVETARACAPETDA